MTERLVSAPVDKPVVLTIAGSDSGGGAGVQADLKTIEATGGFGTSAVTAVTAQNTTGVESSHVLPIEEVDAQIDAVRSDFDVRAVKTGMLATADIVETVASAVADLDAQVVVDPVMIATTGDRLSSGAAESAYETLVAESSLVTPNAGEAAVLTGIEPEDEDAARRAGDRLIEMGSDAALLKGGHVPSERVHNVLVTPKTVESIGHPRVATDATHGSGCMLSAAIATRLAHGEALSTAVDRGIAFVLRAIRYNHDCGRGPGAVHHLVELRNESARWQAVIALESAVQRLLASDFDPLVPAGGTNVSVATPYAEGIDDVASFEGGIETTSAGVEPDGSVRFGVRTPSARRLLDVRELHPDFRAAFGCRFDGDVAAGMDALGWAALDREARTDDEDATNWLAAVEIAEDDVFALANDGTATVLGSAPDALVDGLFELLETM